MVLFIRIFGLFLVLFVLVFSLEFGRCLMSGYRRMSIYLGECLLGVGYGARRWRYGGGSDILSLVSIGRG